MAGFAFNIGVQDQLVASGLNALREAGQDLTPALIEIGHYLVNSTLDRFEQGVGPDGTPWKPSKRAEAEGGQTLIDTRLLMGSIDFQASDDTVEWGTNVIYAAIHQLSGMAGRNHSVFIPARPFIGISAEDEAEIAWILRDHLEMGGQP